MQGIFPMGRVNAGLRLTTAKFYSPDGHGFSRVGVSPDVRVHQVARPIVSDHSDEAVTIATGIASDGVADGEDACLSTALNRLRNVAPRR